jgi:hypothetical protein
MNYRRGIYQLVGLGVVLLLLAGCGGDNNKAKTPIPPTLTSTPEAGMGVPVTSGRWQITILAAREETQITSGYWPNQTTYTPNEGYTFLVVDAEVFNLDPTESGDVSTEQAAVIDANGSIHKADGGGSGGSTDLCVSCITTFYGYGSSLDVAFVFVIDDSLLNKPWKLQVADSTPLAFTVGGELQTPLSTEVGAVAGMLPSTCQLQGLKAPGEIGLLTYDNWSESSVVIGTRAVEGTEGGFQCTGIASGDVQIAPDGALLLYLSPPQGWPGLSVVEPDGTVTDLVKNGKRVNALFDASGRYVIFTVQATDQEGQVLYVFDRQAQTTTEITRGQSVNYRLLVGDRLLITVTSEDWESHSYFSPVDGSALTDVTLPEGVDNWHVAADGEHAVYTESAADFSSSSLVLIKLDGTEKQELASTGSSWGLSGTLSLDGKYVLAKVPEDTGARVELFDVAAGTSTVIVSGVDTNTLTFSADGQWAEALVSEVSDSGWATPSADQTLYIASTADGTTVQQIEKVVNAYFSPDGSRLAYTVRHEDNTLEMFVLTLPDGTAQSLGTGKLSGWWPTGVLP